MLREGLRAELPGLVSLPARLRLPAVPQSSPWLAAVSALGVVSLVSAITGTASSAWFLLFGPYAMQLRNPTATTILADALAIAFAFGAARWRGATAAAGLLTALAIEQLWLGLPGRLLFCERMGTSCDTLEVALTSLWPPAVGIALGAVAAAAGRRAVRHGGPGVVSLLLGLGVAGLLTSAARLAIVPFVGPNPAGTEAATFFDWVIASGAIAAVALGLIIGIFGKRPVPSGVVVLVVYLGTWAPFFYSTYFTREGAPGRDFVLAERWREISPIWSAAAALVAIGAGVLIRRSRTRGHGRDEVSL